MIIRIIIVERKYSSALLLYLFSGEDEEEYSQESKEKAQGNSFIVFFEVDFLKYQNTNRNCP